VLFVQIDDQVCLHLFLGNAISKHQLHYQLLYSVSWQEF